MPGDSTMICRVPVEKEPSDDTAVRLYTPSAAGEKENVNVSSAVSVHIISAFWGLSQ